MCHFRLLVAVTLLLTGINMAEARGFRGWRSRSQVSAYCPSCPTQLSGTRSAAPTVPAPSTNDYSATITCPTVPVNTQNYVPFAGR